MILLEGNCLDEMKKLGDNSVDMVLADIPYGTTSCKWDSVIPLDLMWLQLNRIIKPNCAIVLTASQPFTTTLIASNIKHFKHEWIWIKNRGSNFATVKYQPMKEHESVIVFCDGKVNYYPIKEKRAPSGEKRVQSVFNGSNTGKRDAYSKFKDNRKQHNYSQLRCPRSYQRINIEVGMHPTQKPVELMEYMIRTYTNERETVLDFTMGSGTTGVACNNLNRKFIGIELNKDYFGIAEKRLVDNNLLGLIQ